MGEGAEKKEMCDKINLLENQIKTANGQLSHTKQLLDEARPKAARFDLIEQQGTEEGGNQQAQTIIDLQNFIMTRQATNNQLNAQVEWHRNRTEELGKIANQTAGVWEEKGAQRKEKEESAKM